MRLMRLHMMSEIRRTADSCRSESEAKPARSKKHSRKAGAHGVVGDGMSGSSGRSEPGRPALESEKSRAGVRVPVVAKKRLIIVEPRGAGKWKARWTDQSN
jgi:hypothetical protein